jgi:hypothetical protein
MTVVFKTAGIYKLIYLKKSKGWCKNSDTHIMEIKERRKYQRVQIYDPIAYLSVDSNGNLLSEAVGVARNVSQDGIQIETYCQIESEEALLLFVDLEKNSIEIRGKVIYCVKTESGKFQIGISLHGTHPEKIQFVKELVRSYHHHKEASRLGISQSI